MAEHIVKMCNVKDCINEASYWIDTSQGFNERRYQATSHTFYLCTDHQYELDAKDDNEGGYVHLRIDTGELHWLEIGKYSCAEDCHVCND